MISYDTCLFLTYFTHDDHLWVHPCSCRWHCFTFRGRVLFHCVHEPHLLTHSSCQWSVRWPPWFGCCESCCCEHWGARILWNHGFLQMVCMPFGASFLCRPPACRRCLVGACYKVKKAPYFMPITEILIPASRRPPLPHPLCFEFQALLYGYFLFL